MNRIVLLGCTGYIGTPLVQYLQQQGYHLQVLTRQAATQAPIEGVEYLPWEPHTSWLASLLDGAYGVVNLVGANIGQGRWTRKRKHVLVQSRVQAATQVAQAIGRCAQPPQVWLQASATGYYGIDNQAILTENSEQGKGFLAALCSRWEQPARTLQVPATRVVIVRTGVVLSEQSQVWQQLALPLRIGVLAVPAPGTQHLPWIHLADEVHAMGFLLGSPTAQGVFNLAAPHSCTMQQLATLLATNRRVWLRIRIPRLLLGLLLGRRKVAEVIANSQQVQPAALLAQGFGFIYPDIQALGKV